jgi:hypothetical protein
MRAARVSLRASRRSAAHRFAAYDGATILTVELVR